MQVFEEPKKQDWEALLQRPNFDAALLMPQVQSILDAVALEGDAALFRFSETFDQVQLKSLFIDPALLQAAEAMVVPIEKMIL